MKTEEKWAKGKIWGIDLIAENPQDEVILHRYWDGGVKVNGFTGRRFGSSLQLTFADLIGKDDVG